MITYVVFALGFVVLLAYALLEMVFHGESVLLGIVVGGDCVVILFLPSIYRYFDNRLKDRITALKVIKEDQEKTCRNALRAQHRRTV